MLAWLAVGRATEDTDARTLSGSWGGARQAMLEKGWLWEIGYRMDNLAVASGGHGRQGRPTSHLDIRLRVDLEKTADWHGATVYLNLIDNRGGRPNAEHVGSLLGLSNVEVPVPTHRFLHAWLQQEWGDGQFSLLLGLYPIDSEFMVVDSAGIFVQPPYGALADLALSRGPSIFNNSSFGLRAKWVSGDRSLYAQAALLDGMPGHPNHAVGTQVRFGRSDGTMSIVELGYRPVETGHVFEPATPDRGTAQEAVLKEHEAIEEAGKYGIGAWQYSSHSDDLRDTDALGNPLRRRSRGWYGLAEKTVLPDSPIGDIALFARYSQNDRNSIALGRTANLGVSVKGLWFSRETDSAGLGYTRGQASGKYRDAIQMAGISPARSEEAWELTYRVQANPWLALQPVMQVIRHPAANRDAPTAKIIGLRLDVAL